MFAETYPYYLANKPQQPNADLEVRDKFTGAVAATVAQADAQAIDRAIVKAVHATEPCGKMHAYQRQAVLNHCVKRFTERSQELAMTLCVEAGKPIRDARAEVTRLIDTFRVAAEESVRIGGEVLPLDISDRAKNYVGMFKRVPVGPCSFISPFNFPLNLAAHKIAPAIAAGCPFILKPASLTPIGAILIGQVLAETDLPEGAFSILPCPRDGADLLVTDDRLKLLSFTGSPEVGWEMKARAGKKKVVLELGGNAAVIVDETITGRRLDDAVERIAFGAYYQSGQSCISVQRIYVHDAVYDDFRAKLIEKVNTLRMGDPKEEATFVGPMISQKEAQRVERWINQAVEAGAIQLCGGKREGVMIPATLLENVPKDQPASCDELFGPVATLERFSSF